MRMLLQVLAINCILASIIITIVNAKSKLPRPHGVSFEFATLYHPNAEGKWGCLDGKKIIKFSQVNDDYCDCEDSSDEPGTSACVNGEFHCSNLGHRSEYIKSSRVQDGICDCCDGSDEYMPDETNICNDTCLELGRLEAEYLREKAELHQRGAARRTEMIEQGKKMRAEREARHHELQQHKQDQDAVKAEKQALKEHAESLESGALDAWREQQREREEATKLEQEPLLNSEEAHLSFAQLDTNKDGFVEITELQVDITLDRDRNGVVTIEEAKFFLDERERITLDGFLAITWPRIKTQQLIVQGVFQAPEETEQQAVLEGTELHQEQQQHEKQTGDQHDGEGEEEEEEATEEEEEHFEEEEEGDADVGVGSIANASPEHEYDPETQRLIDEANAARSAYQEAESALREIEQEIKEIHDMNEKDYGAHEEFAALDGQCFTYEDREYVYTLCPFDRAAQKQRNGHSETTLGRWDSWSEKYTQQKYMNGANCWNGPQRSAKVQIRCGIEERIISVSEPNRCEYFLEFETPAACDEVLEHAEAHDEL